MSKRDADDHFPTSQSAVWAAVKRPAVSHDQEQRPHAERAL